MLHAIELFAILSFIATGESLLDIAPRPARRLLLSLAVWVLSFAAGIAILAVRSVAVTAVKVGLVLLTAYVLRWIVTAIIRYYQGPALFEPPAVAELGELAEQVSRLSPPDCRKVARRILRKHDGAEALLGLMSLGSGKCRGRDEFERAWNAACEKARVEATGVAAELESASKSDVLFVVQALCLYERESVERVFTRLSAAKRQGHPVRVVAAEQLAQSGRERKEAQRLGLVASVKKVQEEHEPSGSGLKPADILWPPMGLVRCGFKSRAAALGICHGTLIAYGAIALSLGRSSGWVFLGAAVLIHVQILFAIGDFAWLEKHGTQEAETAEGKAP